MDINKTIGNLVRDAIRVTQSDKTPTQVFIEYSGHVDWLEVRVYPRGWIAAGCLVPEGGKSTYWRLRCGDARDTEQIQELARRMNYSARHPRYLTGDYLTTPLPEVEHESD